MLAAVLASGFSIIGSVASSCIVGSSSVTGSRSSNSTPASGLPLVRMVRSLRMSTTAMVAVLPSR
jgi:hypothetical protein